MLYVKAHGKTEARQAVNLAISAVSHGHPVTLFCDKKLLDKRFSGLYKLKALSKYEDEELTACNSICLGENLENGVFQLQQPTETIGDIRKQYSFLHLESHKHYKEIARRILATAVVEIEVPFHYPV